MDGPPEIRRLDEVVVNRIAAGEVVQRPSAALKEMLENSLDAGSHTITVTANKGGMKLLQIVDNGHGIRSSELPIVCERHTTSKLREFEDLKTISTFGFRGEALASITHVAKVTIVSKTADSPCAYRANYSDGHLIHPPGSKVKPGAEPKPKPCAGITGTSILVEDLFYNMPTRTRSFNPSAEYAKILEVVTRYAIHNGDRSIAFTCKKQGQTSADIHTPANSSVLGNIRIAFGQSLARELLEFSCGEGDIDAVNASEAVALAPADPSTSTFAFNAKGYVSNANYNAKKPCLILFINNRLVDSLSIRRCLESVYKDVLPNHSHPFIYLSLTLPSRHVDVNVHPTKKEVHFMHEEQLLGCLFTALQQTLKSANQSRTFYCQTLLPPTPSTAVVDKKSTKSKKGEETADPQAPAPEETLNLDAGEKEEALDEDAGEKEVEEDVQEAPASDAEVSDSDDLQANRPKKKKAKKKSTLSKAASEPITRKASVAISTENPKPKRVNRRDDKLIRNDSQTQSIDSFFKPAPTKKRRLAEETESSGDKPAEEELASGNATTPEECECPPDAMNVVGGFASFRCRCCVMRGTPVPPPPNDAAPIKKLKPLVETPCTYDSVRTLVSQIHKNGYTVLEKMFKKHVWVGVVDIHLSLVQWDTKLMLINHTEVARELFYQLAIRRFGILPGIDLDSPLSLAQAILTALDLPSTGWNSDDGDKQEIAEEATTLLVSKAGLLNEYFSLTIDTDALTLTQIPLLLENHTPAPFCLPQLLLRLASEVDWTDEVGCFDGVATELANAYCLLPEPKDMSENTAQIRDIWFPAFRQYLVPPRDFSDDTTVMEVASLEKLYKVFERC